MSLTIAEVEHIAQLARLALTEEEKQQYAEQLSAIFDFMEVLNELDTSVVEETSQVTGLEDVLRADETVETERSVRDKLIAAFPQSQGNLLRVKAVFE